MSYMFANSGQEAEMWYVGNLDNWDVVNVVDFSYMFNYAGSYDEAWTILKSR